MHILDHSLIIDDLVGYVRDTYLATLEIMEASSNISSPSYGHSEAIASIRAENLMISVSHDRMCLVEVGINALKLTPKCPQVSLRDTASWGPSERLAEYITHVMTSLAGNNKVEVP